MEGICGEGRNEGAKGSDRVGERGAKSHRGKMSLAQNSIMQMGKFLDYAPVVNPKQ